VTVSDHRVAKIVCARGSQRSCGFKSGAAASFSGTGITVNSTTYNSATSLTVNITIAASSSTGIRNITVSNTDAGAAIATSGFTVDAAPTVSSASPGTGDDGAGNYSIAITGSGFKSGATVSFSGSGITVNSTSVNSAASLTANITIAASATTGPRNITVSNTDVGVGTATGAFVIDAAPVVSSASPGSLAQGASAQNIIYHLSEIGFRGPRARVGSGML
jgi:hypothetical protein